MMRTIRFTSIAVIIIILLSSVSGAFAEDPKARAVECIRNAYDLRILPEEGLIITYSEGNIMRVINMSDNSVYDYYDVRTFPQLDLLAVYYDAEHISGEYLVDYNGNVILEPKYDRIGNITGSDNSITVYQNDKAGLIDRNGNELLEPMLDEIWTFNEGYSHVELNGLHGFIDTNGNYLVEPQYTDAYSFSEGLACVKADGRYGFINTSGEMVIEPTFYDGGVFSNGLCRIMVDGNGYAIINKSGEIVVAPDNYDALWYEYSENGLIWFEKNNKCGYLDMNGNLIAEAQFDEGDQTATNGFAKVVKDGKFGLVGSNGVVIEPVFNYVSNFSEGLVLVKEKISYGYVDTNGNMVIDMQYTQANDFSGGYAAVSVNGKYGFIDTSGNVVIDMIYEAASSFHNGYAAVKLNGKWGIIDMAGSLVLDAVYDNIKNEIPDLTRRSVSAYCHDLFMLKIGDAWGFYNTKSNTISEPAYICRELHQVDGKYVVAYNDDLIYILDSEGSLLY